MGVLESELRGLKGDKQMSQLAVKSQQKQIAECLQNEMGSDMMKVLNGEEMIDLPKSQKIKFKIGSWIRGFFRKF